MASIVDLHCDLLLYLAEGGRSPDNPEVRCSLPQLSKGGVELQVLAIFTETETGAKKRAQKQIDAYQRLKGRSHVHFIPAVENAHAFAEDDNLNKALQTLEAWQEDFPIAYVSLTWNEENRFGGGAHSDVGLKSDGVELLRKLAELSIPLDLSHASDALAFECLELIDEERLSLPVLASHSNARAICPHPRNLSDALASEIIQRKGLIGLNFVAPFLGDDANQLQRHKEHFLSLGAKDALCFGADFFFPEDSPNALQHPAGGIFFPELANSTCYPQNWGENISRKNALRFLNQYVLSDLKI